MTIQMTVTTQGIAVANTLESTGFKIAVGEFRLGSNTTGYTPTTSQTSLRGSTVYTGNPYSVNGINALTVEYFIRLDRSVGTFTFGEIGLYLTDSAQTLFAVGTLPSPGQRKEAVNVNTNQTGSLIEMRILVQLNPADSSAFQVVLREDYLDRLPELSVPDLIPERVFTTSPNINAYVINAQNTYGNSGIASRRFGNIWSLTNYPIQNPPTGVTYRVQSSTSTSITSTSAAPSDLFDKVTLDNVLIQFPTLNLIRTLLPSSSGRTARWSPLYPIDPSKTRNLDYRTMEVEILGTGFQPANARLTNLAGLNPTLGNFMIGNGSAWTSDGVINTRGDIIRGNSQGNPSRLARGATGRLLTSTANDIEWQQLAIASLAEAQAGTENTKPMSALRVRQAFDNLSSSLGSGLGVGQTYQNVTSSRNINTTYTNDTGKPIAVSFTVSIIAPAVDLSNTAFLVDSTPVSFIGGQGIAGFYIVPVGSTYRARANSILTPSQYDVLQWVELR